MKQVESRRVNNSRFIGLFNVQFSYDSYAWLIVEWIITCWSSCLEYLILDELLLGAVWGLDFIFTNSGWVFGVGSIHRASLGFMSDFISGFVWCCFLKLQLWLVFKSLPIRSDWLRGPKLERHLVGINLRKKLTLTTLWIFHH